MLAMTRIRSAPFGTGPEMIMDLRCTPILGVAPYDPSGCKFFRMGLHQAARRGIVGREAVTG